MSYLSELAKKIAGDVRIFFSFKNNVYFALFGACFLIFYQSAQLFIEHPTDYVTFSPQLTIWIQEALSFEALDYALSYYYPAGFILCLILLCYLMIREGKEGWKWGAALMCCWIAHFILEMVYPVAPPLRWASGARAIRLDVFPLSDMLVSVKYGGLPSGHFGYTLLGFLIARFKFKTTGEGLYSKSAKFLLANLVLITFTVLYLGEHTWEDLAASLLVFGGIFYATSLFVCKTDRSVGKTIGPEGDNPLCASSSSAAIDKKERLD